MNHDHLTQEIARMRAARELQQELSVKLNTTTDRAQIEDISRRLFFAREQVLRSTFRIKGLLKVMEGKLHG